MSWLLAVAVTGVVATAVAITTPCQDLNDTYARTRSRAVREVSVYGRARLVAVYWDGRAGSRAAAALLLAAARALGYHRLRLALVPERRPPRADRLGAACALLDLMQEHCHLIDESDAIYDEVVLAPSLAWGGEPCAAMWRCARGDAAPLRLAALGPGAAPGGPALLRALRPAAPPACRRAPPAGLLARRRYLRDCGFLEHADASTGPALWYATDAPRWSEAVAEVRARLAAVSLEVTLVPVESEDELRRRVLRTVRGRGSRASVLFLDCDVWGAVPGVARVRLPARDDGADEPGAASLRLADERVLAQLAPPLMGTFRRFSPPAPRLLEVLEMATARADSDVQEAACSWALRNSAVFESWVDFEPPRRYWIAIFLCDGDPHRTDYVEIGDLIERFHGGESKFRLSVYFEDVACSSESDLNDRLIRTTVSARWPDLIGAVAVAAEAGARMAAQYAAVIETALLLAAPAPALPSASDYAARAAAGSLRQLATATAHILHLHEWKRLAMLSENIGPAVEFFNALNDSGGLAIRNVYLERNAETVSILETLQQFKNAEARIFYLNTNPNISKAVLCIVHELGMTSDDGYVWILREWHPCNLECSNSSDSIKRTNHFTISYWWQNDNDTSEVRDTAKRITSNESLRGMFTDLWRNRLPPPLAVPMADALLSLIQTFDIFRRDNKHRLYDLHGSGTARLLLKNLEEHEVHGILEQLEYKNGHFASPLVYVDRWRGGDREPIARWRVKNGTVQVSHRTRDIFLKNPPGDGSVVCLTKTSGDAFEPVCEDPVWFTTAACVSLATTLLCVWRRLRLKELALQDSILRAQLLAQRVTSGEGADDYDVDRAGLELGRELGRGRHVRVRRGVLRAPGRPPAAVAVKLLRAGAPRAAAADLRREAAALAALRHGALLRLVGVCAAGGPLLVVTAHAFFGDLQRYLVERRHLALRAGGAAGADEADEAYHVSAESVTRLAREAAGALAYLAARRLVHRDVRARSCLVDESRALKLASFGLARSTDDGGAGGDRAEYVCRRRGLFPVPWMAPESLRRGVFSAASDAWALGVLLLELLTLGARPYGAWPPERVLRHVCAGGRPPLPPGLQPATSSLLLACWRRAPDERTTADDLERALAAAPTILRPALAPVVLPVDEGRPPPADEEELFIAPGYEH